uniref:Ribosomal protein S19 n=1 Tax=Navicula ramosissima TaxID=265559 RepID=A0A343A6X5_9STRA|nr:ribosomal protein S19 [Navicula ramosissima]AOY40413.1 ribosomal protein S19 [Navicula ramosissima]
MKRPKWKGFFTKPENYINQTTNDSKKISRNSSIIPKFINQTFQVHNGKIYKEINVTKDMLGHKFGEFIKTRVEFEFKKKKKKKKK